MKLHPAAPDAVASLSRRLPAPVSRTVERSTQRAMTDKQNAHELQVFRLLADAARLEMTPGKLRARWVVYCAGADANVRIMSDVRGDRQRRDHRAQRHAVVSDRRQTEGLWNQGSRLRAV